MALPQHLSPISPMSAPWGLQSTSSFFGICEDSADTRQPFLPEFSLLDSAPIGSEFRRWTFHPQRGKARFHVQCP